MQKKLLISIISCFIVVLSLNSQTVGETIAWGKQQMTLEEYENALKAFRRASFFSHSKGNDLSALMADCLEKTGKPDEALRFYDLSAKAQSDPATINAIMLKKANLLAEMQRYDQALQLILKLPSGMTPDQYLLKEYYLGIIYFNKGYYPESEVHFRNLLQNAKKQEKLDSLFDENYRIINRYRPNKARLLNIILPGAGYMYAGEPGKALKSVLFTGGAVVLFGVTARYEDFTDGIIANLPWFQNTYIGGINGAGQIVNTKLEKAQTNIYSKIILLTEPDVY